MDDTAVPGGTRLRAGARAVDGSHADADEKTYSQILKSTALVGGSSVVNIAMGMIRTKAMAMLLGPAGFGLAGLYMSIVNLTQSISGLGVNSSGVRQIAEAAGSNDEERIARTAGVLRRVSVFLGVLGAAILVAFSRQISIVTFGTSQHAAAICLLSLVVFFNLVSAGQGALIQGLRHISDLAQMGALGALYGTILTIPIVYFMRLRGVVPSLAAVAAMSLATSWWYSRKVQVPRRALSFSDAAQEARPLLKLGVAFMASGIMTMGSAYLTRIIVVHRLGLEAAGFYQSAWTLGGLYVGFILQAMGADFYPRLTAAAHDNAKCNRLVNEQTRVSLLLAGPGVIATLTIAPVVISLFYSPKFGAAVEVLRWICLGAALQAVTWPMGFIIIAKGEQSLFLFCEVAWAVVSVLLAWLCVGQFALKGAGIAFFGSYVFHLCLLYPIVNTLTEFRWSGENRNTCILFIVSVCGVFLSLSRLSFPIAMCVGATAVAAAAAYSLKALLSISSIKAAPALLRVPGYLQFIRRLSKPFVFHRME